MNIFSHSNVNVYLECTLDKSISQMHININVVCLCVTVYISFVLAAELT